MNNDELKYWEWRSNGAASFLSLKPALMLPPIDGGEPRHFHVLLTNTDQGYKIYINQDPEPRNPGIPLEAWFELQAFIGGLKTES